MESCINGDNFSCALTDLSKHSRGWQVRKRKKKLPKKQKTKKPTTVGFTGRQKELEFKALVYLYEWKAPGAMTAFSH